ncbi:MAG: zinc ABC transporter substrate-binding protein, partial [Rhodobacteraceae bacterium]|nr:zinc ABC transporter substrate-binding protein [Paracoccaceae bacterium]
LGDMVERVGGEHAAVTALVGANGDTHVYQPTPAAARAVSDAAILVVNGLEFEGWLDRLIDASDFDGVRVVATQGVEPIAYEEDDDEHGHDEHEEPGHEEHSEEEHGHEDHEADEKHEDDEHAHGETHEDDHADEHEHKDEDHAEDGHHDHDHGAYDPHAWQSLGSAVTYVTNIAAALAEVDPENTAAFKANRDAYIAEIKALDAEIREIVEGIAESDRTIVTSHDAFQYFGRDYGLTFLAPQGLSTESEASAKNVAQLIEQIREHDIKAVFVENITDPRLLARIAEESGAVIGGTLYPGALSGADGPAPTYLDMMRHNAKTLSAALSS